MFSVLVLAWFYITATCLVAWAAAEKGRSGAGWFMLSLIASPLLCLLTLIAIPSIDRPALPPLNR